MWRMQFITFQINLHPSVYLYIITTCHDMLLLNNMRLFLLMLMMMKDQYAMTTTTILKFEPHKSSWVQVGNMSHARAAHGASVVNMKDIEKFCT